MAHFNSYQHSQDHHVALGLNFVGMMMAGFANSVVLSCPTLFVAIWFGENERATANMIGTAADPLGLAIASLVSPALVHSASDMRTMLWVFAIPAILGLILTLIFVMDEPPTPPSAGAAEPSDSFVVGLKKLYHNRPYLLLMVSFGLATGAMATLLSFMAQIMNAQGYTDVCHSATVVYLFPDGFHRTTPEMPRRSSSAQESLGPGWLASTWTIRSASVRP